MRPDGETRGTVARVLPELLSFASLSSGHCRLSARQRDHGAQTGLVVLQLELAAVQPRDGGGKAQPQAGTWLRTALFEPHKALHRATAINFGNAAAGVFHRQQNSLAVRHRL